MKKLLLLLILSVVGLQINAHAQQSDYFITTWKTNNPGSSNNTSITIPTTSGGYNYDVSWKNDGNWETGFTGNATHDYGIPGIYTLAIRGDFPRIYFNNGGDREKIVVIEQWGNNVWSSMQSAFSGCSNLVANATDVPDLSNVTDMGAMFYKASVFNNFIGDWDVSNVITMGFMFSEALNFNQSIGDWDVSNVTNMDSMFNDANSFNQPIGNWDVSSVSNMFRMFYGADSFNQPIGNWDVNSVTLMAFMFRGASNFNQPIGNWDVSNVTNMSYMFGGASSFNHPIGDWDVENVTDMSNMFTSASSFNQPIGNWDVSNVTSMREMFFVASSFNQPIGNWDVSNVTNMSSVFRSASTFNQPLGNWDVVSATDMSWMFGSASSFNEPIGNWDVSNVTTTYSMFEFASSFNHPIDNWDVSGVIDMSQMFRHALNFNQTLESWTLKNLISAENMLFATNLDCENYSSILFGWATNPETKTSIALGLISLEYSPDVILYRDFLINELNWTINGDAQGTCTLFINCELPSDIVLSNITETSVDMSWTSGSANILEFIVLYVETGFDPLLYGISLIVTETFVNITGLEEGTEYDVYVKSVCQSGEESDLLGPKSFITLVNNEVPIITCVPNATRSTNLGVCQYTIVNTEFDATFTASGNGTITNNLNGTATLAGAVLPKGNTTIFWTVVDDNGQTATCATVITVKDNEAPVITCVPNATRYTDPGVYQYTIIGTEFDAVFTDNCSDGNITNSLTGSATLENKILPVGETTIVWTVNDGNGQTATCTTIITVEDNEGPVIICVPNATRSTNLGVCQYTVVNTEFDATFTASGNGTITNNLNGTATLAGAVLPKGNTTIVWTVVDDNGQTATCASLITVEDNEAPTITCPSAIITETDPGSLFYILPEYFLTGDVTTSDNCTNPLTITSQDPAPGSSLPEGVHIITLTAQDDDGNIETCNFELTVDAIVGIDDNDQALGTVTLYPVPTKNILNIGNPQNLELDRLEIFDLSGRLVQTADLRDMGNVMSIDINHFAVASYHVRIIGKYGLITRILIKE